jgi:hypothetical protein
MDMTLSDDLSSCISFLNYLLSPSIVNLNLFFPLNSEDLRRILSNRLLGDQIKAYIR